MKKILFILFALFLGISCIKKDDPEPQNENPTADFYYKKDTCFQDVCFPCELNETQSSIYDSLYSAYTRKDHLNLTSILNNWNSDYPENSPENEILNKVFSGILNHRYTSENFILFKGPVDIAVDHYFHPDSTWSGKSFIEVAYFPAKLLSDKKILLKQSDYYKAYTCFQGKNNNPCPFNTTEYQIAKDTLNARYNYLSSQLATPYDNAPNTCYDYSDMPVAISFNQAEDEAYILYETDYPRTELWELKNNEWVFKSY